MYAHATIELPDGRKLYRGDEVPADMEGLEALQEGGAVCEEPYNPDAEPKQVPDVVEIEGVIYKRSNDGAEAADASA